MRIFAAIGSALAAVALLSPAGSQPRPPAPAGSQRAPAAAPAKPAACPDDMALVEGDYCTDLEVRCEEKFFAPQNHLWVCKRVAEPTRCVGERRPVRYCIDKFEFPNKAGLRPMVMQNFWQAQLHCAAHGKRVCTESEWTKACEGPNEKPFPYGYVRDPSICRGDRPWDRPDKAKLLERDPAELERLWQGLPSGSQPKCVSDYGVFDMAGNADELAASETKGTSARDDFANVTTGGPWYFGVRNMCRPKIRTHDETFAYYYLSWRCCAEPDGKPTDPVAPKQRAKGVTWERVDWLAHHSWKMPYNPLEPGQPGYSAAGPRD